MKFVAVHLLVIMAIGLSIYALLLSPQKILEKWNLFFLAQLNTVTRPCGLLPKVEIPMVIIQTYHDKKRIPAKVYENIRKFAPDYRHIVYDDSECLQFIQNHFGQRYAAKFKSLKYGAHKADLFRYCYLYTFGGVYLDIKTELITPLHKVFITNAQYTVLSKNNGSIYQGVLVTKPKEAILFDAIEHILQSDDAPPYQAFTEYFYHLLQRRCGSPHLNIGSNPPWILLEEKCTQKSTQFTEKTKCSDGYDRYGYCCFIFQNDKPVIKTRYADFPW